MKQSRTDRWVRRTLLVLATAGTFISPMTQAVGAPGPKSCVTAPEVQELDFWLGNWTVVAKGDTSTSSSKVSLSLDKCLFVESWDDGKGHSGEDLFAYSADDKSWYGMFADNMGRVHLFTEGKVASGTAEFHGPSRGRNGEAILNRVKLVRTAPNKLEQTWEKSSDNGSSWTTIFRGEYTRTNP